MYKLPYVMLEIETMTTPRMKDGDQYTDEYEPNMKTKTRNENDDDDDDDDGEEQTKK